MRASDLQRVEISDQILKHFLKKISDGRVSEMAHDIGLPYGLVYNLVYGRIKSLSTENYKLIFGEYPPNQALKRVNGTYFREMVRLWLYLNGNVAEADLYREFYRDKKFKKIDYRIFSGATKTVDNNLEKVMEKKFFDQEFNRKDIKELTKEIVLIEDKERVPYQDIKPILDYLEKKLEVNPTRVLNQLSLRYEYGELKTVPKKVYDFALNLQKRTEKALNSGSRLKVERIREEVYGKRKGLTLYSEIEKELEFLQKQGMRSIKQHLGRSVSYYKKSQLKRVASWRARRIQDACSELIDNKPELTLKSLPKTQARERIKKLLSVLRSILIVRVIKDEDGIESNILMPAYYDKENFETSKYGLISIDKTAYFLGMSKMAFDLMVAMHSAIFRKIGTYNRKLYLPYVYLHKLKRKKGFDLIKAKYEVLAKDYEVSHCRDKNTEQSVHASKETVSLQIEDAQHNVRGRP